MKMKKIILFFLTLYSSSLLCQEGAQIFKQLKKLNTLASVLYVAAHPDDENTRLISLFSNHYNARTAYLSMTRGDGGQNLIGTELREELGLIRTQELIEARKIDGGEQFFTTANDFGFSKHPEETLSIWNEKEILSQIVYRFRQFKPDIIIHRFDHRTPGNTHGHHTSSAILSERAFQLEHSGQWVKGKSCDTFGPIGPYLVTKDEVSDPQNLSMWLEVNGKRMQDGSTKTMVYGVNFLVSYLSQFMSLQPGDIISTGTPPGVGMGLKPQIFLKPGDEMKLGIEGLGTQTQKTISA